MSAITGIFYRDGRKVDPELIKKMNDRLSHRGPDGSAVCCDGSIALGHQMLWTTPESLHEKLPFHDENADLVITADARIDNRKELSEELDIEDKEDVSDSYFILKAYEKWGEKCPEYLLGDFAFAIWDENEEKLFCARDHMGVKSFYYYLSEEIFLFATEMKALFTIPEISRRINEVKILYYLMKVNTDKKFTFYKDINSLTAACSLKVSKNSSLIKEFWKIDPESRLIMDSDEDYIQAFHNIFTEAVHCRLRSAFQIGFELSGGLDSSSVVCMARKILNKNQDYFKKEINTFSMVFNDFPEVDESYYIKRVTNIAGIKSNLISSDKISPLNEINTILWHQEQPFYTPNMSILYNMQKNMKDKGIRILLSGTGGDQTINLGRNYFRDLFIKLKWQKLISELFNYSKNANVNFINLFFVHVIIPIVPDNLKNFIIKLWNAKRWLSNELCDSKSS